jgi:hypothetical protein
MVFVMKKDVAADPIDAGGFGTDGIMGGKKHPTQLFEQLGLAVHDIPLCFPDKPVKFEQKTIAANLFYGCRVE